MGLQVKHEWSVKAEGFVYGEHNRHRDWAFNTGGIEVVYGFFAHKHRAVEGWGAATSTAQVSEGEGGC